MPLKNISYLSVVYIIAWCISPPLDHGNLYRMFAIVALLIVIVSSIGTALQSQKNRLTVSVLIIAYIILIAFMCGESYTLRIGVIILILTGVSFELWIDSPQSEENKLWNVIFWIIILYAIWNTTTIRAVLEQPNIMRRLVSNEKAGDVSISVWGVGGYGYMYSAILMMPIGLDILLKRRQVVPYFIRIITLYFVATTLVLSYLSQYFLALIVAVVGVILSIAKTRNARRINPSAFLSVLVIFIIIGLMMEPILDYLIQTVSAPKINQKLVDMRAVMIYGESIEDSDFATRYERYTRDLRLIINNPVIGALKYMAIGKHSTFLDLLAQYGVIIGGISVSMLIRPCVQLLKKSIPLAGDFFILLLIIGLFNVLTLQVVAPLCFALPAYCKLVWEE